MGINRYPVCDRWWWHMRTSHAGQLLGIFSRWPSSCCHSVGEWPRIGLHSSCRQTSIKGIQLTWAFVHTGVMLWDGYKKATLQALIMETASTKVNSHVWGINKNTDRSAGICKDPKVRDISGIAQTELSVWYCNLRLPFFRKTGIGLRGTPVRIFLRYDAPNPEVSLTWSGLLACLALRLIRPGVRQEAWSEQWRIRKRRVLHKYISWTFLQFVSVPPN